MSNFLYSIAIILVIVWLVGFFIYNVSNEIHFLLLLAILASLTSFMRARNARK
jgi:hypothetical protein